MSVAAGFRLWQGHPNSSGNSGHIGRLLLLLICLQLLNTFSRYFIRYGRKPSTTGQLETYPEEEYEYDEKDTKKIVDDNRNVENAELNGHANPVIDFGIPYVLTINGVETEVTHL